MPDSLNHADLGELPAWDLSDLYAGPDCPALAADLTQAETGAAAFAARYQGKLAGFSGAELAQAVAEYERLDEVLSKVMSFAGLLYASNMADPNIGRFYQGMSERVTGISVHLLFFTLEINRLEDAALEAKLANPDLAAYRPFLRDTRIFRPHQLSDELEKLLHEKYNCKAYLLLVGDGVLRPAIEAAVLSSGISSYIKLAGLQKDVRPFYQTADIFTLVSTSVETFSIAALEAMSCGLTEVLTDVGGAAEMVSPGVNGFLCIPEDDSIAQNWLKGLNSDFKKEDIHAYAYTHFRKEKMVLSYKKIFGLAS